MNYKFLKKTLILILLLHCYISYGQKEGFRFQSLSTENGLSNNFITCTVQDSYGFMWIGTDEGLNKYDGYDVKIFTQKLKDSTSLINNHISSLYLDSKNRLWVGTFDGLCLYNPDKENFTIYRPQDISSFNKRSIRVTSIFEDKNKDIIFCTEMGDLYKIENEKLILLKRFKEFTILKHCIIDEYGNFWLGDMKGIVYYNPKTDEVKNFQFLGKEDNNEKISMVNALLEDDEIIWAGSALGQLIMINKKNFQVKKYPQPNNTLNFIFDINKDKNGFLYVGSNEGLYIIDKTSQRINYYTHQPYDKDGLNASTVSSIYFDKNENLWIGTVQGGINYSIKGKKFTNYNLYSKPISLDLSSVESMLVDSRGNWWLGSYNKGINLINPKTGEKELFMPVENDPYTITRSSVMHIFEDSKKRIWVSSYYGYLQQYMPEIKKFKPYYFDHLNNGYKEVTDIRSIVEDNEGNLWFIAHGFGLFKFNPETNNYKYFTRDDNNTQHTLIDTWSFQVLNQHDSILWIGSPSGISKFDIEKETFTNYYHNNDSNSLSNNYVNMVYIDTKENIWIGTFYGLNLFNRKTNTFYHYYENDGLASSQIKSIIEEKPGRYWLATGVGITCMDVDFNKMVNGKPKIKFRNYNESDNIQDKFFWERSVAKSPDGKILFGSQSGIVIFNPGEIKDNTDLPDIYLTELDLFNKKIEIGDYDSLLQKKLAFTNHITLNYSQNIITIKYVALNYLSTPENKYAYKLEGFDKLWNYVGSKREATYTNLDAGEYTFKVIASNNDGYWNQAGTSLRITIKPPWWETWWFRICLVLIIVGIIISFYYIRFSFYSQQQKKLNNMVRARTLELEESTSKLEERQNEINQQNEELINQRTALSEANKLLIEQQEKILEQNKELYAHRHQLEKLIEERTHELIAAKERAEESDRLKSSFLANLSHEIRTPLNAIMGFSNIMSSDELTPEEISKFNQIVQSSGISLLNLIDDIIDFSKIESGHINLNIRDVPLKGILESVNQIFAIQFKFQSPNSQKKVDFKIVTDLNIDKIILKTDELRLNQILTNLINNAIKFTQKGKIEVGYKILEKGKMLEFYVQDTGLGIKKEKQKFIFQRFTKIEEKQNELHRGAGLGLAICYQLVQLLGGTIRVDSEPFVGSTFYFTIPFKQGAIKENNNLNVFNIKKIPDLQGGTIIIAEDDDANYAYIKKIMEKTNSKLIRASNGMEVLSFLENDNNVSLILMDIKMPKMNGTDTLKEIRKKNFIIPIIAQTAHALSEEIYVLKESGFDEYISKPIIPSELYLKINKVLNI